VSCLEIYIFGPFWEGVSGEIKTGSITNLPTIYQNAIYIVDFCHQLKVTGFFLAREIKNLKSAVLVNDSVKCLDTIYNCLINGLQLSSPIT
jgi:hypothetical protein